MADENRGGSGANAITSTVITQQGFDGNSNLVRLVDNNGGTTVWAFDSHDRQISETYQDNSRRSYASDTANDVVSYTDANGSAFVNAWDAMDF